MSLSIIRSDGETMTLDATFRERGGFEQRITDHPIEDGSTVTDHLQKLPETLVVDAAVTESPASATALRGTERVLNAVEFLRGCIGQEVDVVTVRFGTLERWGIKSVQYDVTHRRSLPITILFRELEFAQTGTVSIPPEAPADVASDGAPDATDSGTQSTSTVSDEDAAEDKSLLASFVDLF